MSIAQELRHLELLIAGLFHSTGAIIDRLIENGAVERVEIDAALQAVEDRAFAETDPALNRRNPARQALARSARVLRVINAKGSHGHVLTTRELRAMLQFEQEV